MNNREGAIPKTFLNWEYQGIEKTKRKVSQISKQREGKTNATRRDTEERQDMKVSRIGTDDMSMCDQTETSQEKSEGLIRETMTKARNWIEIIIATLLCSMILHTICHLTGIAREIMCYLVIGMKLTIDVKEQKNKKGSLLGDQNNSTKEIGKKGTKLEGNLISSRTKTSKWRKPGELIDAKGQDTESEDFEESN